MASVFLLFRTRSSDEELYAYSTEEKAEEAARRMIRLAYPAEVVDDALDIKKLEKLLDDKEKFAELLELWFWINHGTGEIRVEELTLDLPVER